MTSVVKSLSLAGIFMAKKPFLPSHRVEAMRFGRLAILNSQFSILNFAVHAQTH
jgi:hypothetical protein